MVCRYVERNALRGGLVDRAEHWRWGSLWRWTQSNEPEPELFSTWPLRRQPDWVNRVNTPLSAKELEVIRRSVNRGSPYGQETWVESIARRFDLEMTIRPRGRPPKKPLGTHRDGVERQDIAKKES